MVLEVLHKLRHSHGGRSQGFSDDRTIVILLKIATKRDEVKNVQNCVTSFNNGSLVFDPMYF